MIALERISKSDKELKQWMNVHYSQPKGFVGRQLIYKIIANGIVYGAIAGGSATKNLPGRIEFFGQFDLQELVNNTFFHVEKDKGYPCRNFTTKVVSLWREREF